MRSFCFESRGSGSAETEGVVDSVLTIIGGTAPKVVGRWAAKCR